MSKAVRPSDESSLVRRYVALGKSHLMWYSALRRITGPKKLHSKWPRSVADTTEAFTIFQAIPHYGYMKLKMPGPNGIITLASDRDIALRTENKTAALALEALSEALVLEELTALRSIVDRDDVILDKRSKSTSFKPADEIVKFQVHPTQLNPAADTAL